MRGQNGFIPVLGLLWVLQSGIAQGNAEVVCNARKSSGLGDTISFWLNPALKYDSRCLRGAKTRAQYVASDGGYFTQQKMDSQFRENNNASVSQVADRTLLNEGTLETALQDLGYTTSDIQSGSRPPLPTLDGYSTLQPE